MNETIKSFIEDLKQRSDVLGIILFGSYARGNNRPNSDVDLVVILSDGYSRTVEHKNGQAFEIIYTTEKGAFDYWESHRDDAAELWEVAKILYDKDGAVESLKIKIQEIISVGKKAIDKSELEQLRFDAEDQIRYVEDIILSDSTTANLILTNKIFILTGRFFDIKQMWSPSPKQRLAKIKDLNQDLYILLESFYRDGETLENKLIFAKNIIKLIF